MIIDRHIARARIGEAFSVHPAVAPTRLHQCEKTTLARAVAAGGLARDGSNRRRASGSGTS